MITIISAMSDNKVIGINNKLPWYLPADLQHFKKTTMDKPMIMGRKTWESLPGILPGRPHIVVTRNKSYIAEGAIIVHSLDEAIKKANHESIMIVGGANLYTQALKVADQIVLTEVHTTLDGDAFFPEFDKTTWKEQSRKTFVADEKNKFDFDFVVYKLL